MSSPSPPHKGLLLQAIGAAMPISLAASALMFGGSLLWLSASLSLKASGASDQEVSLLTTAFFLGFTAGGLWGPLVIRHLRHRRAFTLFSFLAALTGVGYSFGVDGLYWSLLRGLYGFAAAGYFTTMESWLNAQAVNEVRARAMTFYMTCYYLAVGLGQLLINIWPPTETTGFYVAAGLVLLANLPIWLFDRVEPLVETARPLGLRLLLRAAPLAIIGSAVGGVLSGGVHSLFPVVAQDMGLTLAQVSYVTAAISVGPFLVLWMFSRLSDQSGRRPAVMLICACLFVIAVMLYLLEANQSLFWPFFALTLLLGGCLSSIYPNAISQAFDRLPQATYVGASGTLLLAFSLGGVVGPSISALFVGWLGPHGLFLFAASVALLFLAALFLAGRGPRTVTA